MWRETSQSQFPGYFFELMAQLSFPLLYPVGKLWHFVQLKCLFETLAKKLFLCLLPLIILLRCVK